MLCAYKLVVKIKLMTGWKLTSALKGCPVPQWLKTSFHHKEK